MRRRDFIGSVGVTSVASWLSAACGAPAAPKLGAPPPPVAGAQHDMDFPMTLPAEDQPIAMLLYPKFTALDLVAPQYIFSSLMRTQVHLVAKTRDPVVSDTGLAVLPTATFRECPSSLEVLFVPGGTMGTAAAMDDEDTLSFLADRARAARFVTSVCTGSLLLGAAGLLTGYRATSHWLVRERLRRLGATPVDARVVEDRNRVTGAGVTAGFDFGLRLAERLRGADYAKALELNAEYDPQPPYRAGSPAEAGPDLTGALTRLYGGAMDRLDGAVARAERRLATTSKGG